MRPAKRDQIGARARVVTLPELEFQLAQHALDFGLVIRVGGREQKMDVDGAVGGGLGVYAEFDVRKQEPHVRQTSRGLTPANFLVGLDAEVVGNAERFDPGIGLLDPSQIRLPVPAELVVEQRARRV